MAARNTATGYGWVSRALHWTMAAVILGMIALGFYMTREDLRPEEFWLYNLHKSLGVTLFAAALLRLGWHRISPPPPAGRDDPVAWRRRAARLVHATLYAVLLAMPVAGFVGSVASGLDTVLFGVIVPPFMPASKELTRLALGLHDALAAVLVALLSVHVTAALYHGLVLRDATLRRMLRG